MYAKKHQGLHVALRDVRTLPPPALTESDLKPLSKIQPLKFAAMRYAYRALKTNNWHRTQTAIDLNISLRVMRNYISDFRSYGWELPPLNYHNPRPTKIVTEDESDANYSE